MKCADCGSELQTDQRGGVPIQRCRRCEGVWVLDCDFKTLRDSSDRFIRWLDPDLWSDIAKHEVGRSARECPVCRNKLHDVRYADSDIVIDICPQCRGIWLKQGELPKIITYLEGLVDAKTVQEYVREMGHEAREALAHQSRILNELKNMGILMKLLEYRIITRFPALSQIAAKLPPV